MNNFIAEQNISSHLNQQPIWIGDSLRYATCPNCGATHNNSPAFTVDLKKNVYFGHCCNRGGSVTELLGITNSFKINKNVPEIQSQIIATANKPASEIFNEFYEPVKELSRTERYLSSRGIRKNTYADLNFPIRECIQPYKGLYSIAAYPLISSQQEIVAFQRVLVKAENNQKVGKRYTGEKSAGVSILKNLPKLIVAEGLETGLSVRQFLGNSYGLIVCGDANNMKKLATDHIWAIKDAQLIIVAADNDLNGVGTAAAREILFKFPQKAIVKAPSLPGKDWNDVLIEGAFSKEWL